MTPPQPAPPAAPAAKAAPPAAKLIMFRLGDERYAMPLTAVRELGRVPPITPVPRVPAFVAGVANLRGNVIGLIDLRAVLCASGPAGGDRRRMIVLQVDGVTVGVLVDAVDGVVVPEGDLDPPVPTLSDALRPFVRGHLHHANSTLAVLEPSIVPALRDRVEAEAG